MSYLPTGLSESSHSLLRGVQVGSHLRGDRRLIDGSLVVVLGMRRVDHLGRLTTGRTEVRHSLYFVLFMRVFGRKLPSGRRTCWYRPGGESRSDRASRDRIRGAWSRASWSSHDVRYRIRSFPRDQWVLQRIQRGDNTF